MLGIRGSLKVEAMLIVWKTSNLGSISTSSTIQKIGLNSKSLGIDRGSMVEADWEDKYMTHTRNNKYCKLWVWTYTLHGTHHMQANKLEQNHPKDEDEQTSKRKK
jgi:hypothetical protein